MRVLKTTIGLAALLIAFVACKKNEETPDASVREQEALKLEAMLTKIKETASATTCDGQSEWGFMAVGTKPCGTPAGYIAYPMHISESFSQEVEKFKKEQQAFYKKWNIASDCSVLPIPIGVTCKEGKAVLVYEDPHSN